MGAAVAMRGRSLELVLFMRDPGNVSRAFDGGIHNFIVDMEWRGKEGRQAGADTQIDPASAEDLVAISDASARARARVSCRVNPLGPWTAAEIEHAAACGVARIFLPMVRNAGEVDAFVRLVAGRCETAILIETQEAVVDAPNIAKVPVEAVYVGLNDLSINRGTPNIFPPLIDGTVERMHELFADRKFGFGGVTGVDFGKPLPCRLLLQEMVRLDCSFSFLRRSFMNDLWPRPDLARQIARVQEYVDALVTRDEATVMADHLRLREAVAALSP
jgi:hypothetical protein